MPVSKQNSRSAEKEEDRLFGGLWGEFRRRFPDEKSCLDEIWERMKEQAKYCNRCHQADVNSVRTGRLLKCDNCNTTGWATAGTFFHGIRAARPWLAAIWLMERGVTLSSNQLHRLVEVSQSTAFAILKKVSFVIAEHLNEEQGTAESADFFSIFSRRSRETPARNHPSAEETEQNQDREHNAETNAFAAEDITPERTNADCVNTNDNVTFDSDYTPNQLAVLHAIKDDLISFDELSSLSSLLPNEVLSALTILELDGAVTRAPGNFYRRAKYHSASSQRKVNSTASPAEDLVEKSIKYLRENFQGISRKYLQLYLGIEWCCTQKTSKPRSSLLDACARFRRVSYNDILAYVTASVIVLPDGPVHLH